MLICGQEEPLHLNEQIHRLDEETGRICLGDTPHEDLNRYSFLWSGHAAESTQAFGRLLRALFTGSPAPATWLFGFQGQRQGFGRVGTLRQRSTLERDGWEIHEDDLVALASKPADLSGDRGFEPPPVAEMDSHLLMVIGDLPVLESLFSGPAGPSIRMMVRRFSLAPSSQFLNWVADHRLAVVYRQNDDLGRPGLIIVAPWRIATGSLLEEGIIQDVKTGPEAEHVWRLSP